MTKKDTAVESASMALRKPDLQYSDLQKIIGSLSATQQAQLRKSLKRRAESRESASKKAVQDAERMKARALVSLITTLLLGRAEGDAVDKALKLRTHTTGLTTSGKALLDYLWDKFDLVKQEE